MIKIIPRSKLRTNFADALAMAKKEKAIIITKSGRPDSALVDLDYFEDLLALDSPSYIESIHKARQDAQEGRLYSHNDVFGNLA